MSKKFDHQEKSEFVKKLRDGIKQMPEPPSPELDWDSILKKVFARLDAQKEKGIVSKLGDFLSTSVRMIRSPVPAFAVSAAGILLMAGIAVFLIRLNAGHQQLTGRLVHSSGVIECVENAGKASWQQIKGPAQFRHGTAMKTGPSSYLLIELEKGSRFFLSGPSELVLEQLKKEKIAFRLDYGILSVKREEHHGPQRLTVATPHMVFEALGTVFRVEEVKGSLVTRLTVFSGAVKALRKDGAHGRRVYYAPCQVVFQGDSPEKRSFLTDDPAARAVIDSFDMGPTIPIPQAQLQFVSVFSVPDDAEVFFDSVPAGRTPLNMQLPLGNHQIRLVKKGFKDITREIMLSRENACRIFISLSAENSIQGDSVIPHFDAEVIIPEAHPVTAQLGGVQDAGNPMIDSLIKAEATRQEKIGILDSGPPAIRPRQDQVIAGTLYNRTLYWDLPGLRLDTIQWPETYRAVTGSLPGKVSWNTAMSLSKNHGKRFIELKNASAASVCVLLVKGYQVIALTQWTGKTKIRNIDTRGQFEQENMISDFSWERIEHATLARPSGLIIDYAVALSFANGGVSTYPAKEKMNLSRVPIAGEKEFVLRENFRDITVEGSQYRLVIRLFAVADAGKSNKDIISGIEQGMDSLKLDMSYKPPELNPVGKY